MIKTPLSTMIGGAFWTPNATIIGGASKTFDQLIKSLFANNEQGFAYDPNDLSTMFQDAAGTVPVTAVGQPVGLMLDKGRGLLKTELIRDVSFDNPSNWYVQPTGATGVAITNGMLVCNSASNDRAFQANTTISANTQYTVEIDIVSYIRGDPFILCAGVEVYLPKSVGRHTVSFITTTAGANIGVYSGRISIGGEWSASSISVTKVEGNHAYQTASASRPILQRNATTGAYYLAFDGSDDFLQTSSIDFTATDKVSLFTGVRKLSDVSIASVFCLAASPTATQGTFEVYTPHVAGGEEVVYYSRGSTTKSTLIAEGLKAPSSFVLSAKTDISSNSTTVKINSSTFPSAVVGLGGGYFGNHPLYIGRRAGTIMPFNGHLYSLIGIGRLTTDNETIALEKAIAKNTEVTLNV